MLPTGRICCPVSYVFVNCSRTKSELFIADVFSCMVKPNRKRSLTSKVQTRSVRTEPGTKDS